MDKILKNPVNLLIFGAGLYLIILLGGGLKKLMEKLGLKDNAKDKAISDLELALAKIQLEGREDAAKAAQKAIKDQFAAQKSTKSEAEWVSIADVIYADLRYSSLDDNKEDAGYQVCRVQNETDVYKLFQAFGKRWETFLGLFPFAEQSLPEFVRSNLTKEKIGKINANYASKGIKFRY